MNIVITKTDAGTLVQVRDQAAPLGKVTDTRLYNTGADLSADANNVIHLKSKNFSCLSFKLTHLADVLGAADEHAYIAAASAQGLFTVATTATV